MTIKLIQAEKKERRTEQVRQAQQRRRDKLRRARGFAPTWWAVEMIKAAMNEGATYEEAESATLDVLHEYGLSIQ